MEFTSKKLTRFPILKQYYYSCKAGEINYDPRQVRILKDFESFAKKLNNFSFRRKKYPTGIYIFGSVGIGKTYLSGILYDNIKMPKKRIHLHEFMYLVYDLLNEFDIINAYVIEVFTNEIGTDEINIKINSKDESEQFQK